MIAEIAGVILGVFLVYDTFRIIGVWGSAGVLEIVTLVLAYVAFVSVLYVATILLRPRPHRGR